jgi:hypothetical protein
VELVGRGREQARISELLDRTVDGFGGLLVVVGPAGAGKSALADYAAVEGKNRGLEVVRAVGVRDQPQRLVWAQALTDLGADSMAQALLGTPEVADLDAAARTLVAGTRRLLVLDDLDAAGPTAIDLLRVVAGRLSGGGTAVLVTATDPPGVGREMTLRPLTEDEIGAAVAEDRPAVRHALWLASRGLPGAVRELAAELAGHPDREDPVVELALRAPSRTAFLDVDPVLLSLLQAAAERPATDASRSRVLARLARELLGDASAADRRRTLVDEALDLARRSGEWHALAEALGARLYALWDPHAAEDRLIAAAELIELARRAGDGERERDAMFWRFVALMELGRIGEAEAVLAAYDQAAERAGDAAGKVMVMARYAMLATMRGRFDDGDRLVADIAAYGRRIGLPDTENLSGVGAWSMRFRSKAAWPLVLEKLRPVARRRPGHFFDADIAEIEAMLGRTAEAAATLERLLPEVLVASGPRWVSVVVELTTVVAVLGDAAAAEQLYAVLLPYEGRLVIRAGAVIEFGPASHYLGVLSATAGRLADGCAHFQRAVAFEERTGGLPMLATTLAAYADLLDRMAEPDRAGAMRTRARTLAERLGMSVLLDQLDSDAWSLRRDGDDWVLAAGPETARLRDSRGLQYLRALLAAPNHDVAALDLAAGGAGLAQSRAPEVLDSTARLAYGRRLDEIGTELDAADRAGDASQAARLETERSAIVAELRHATGLGGRTRRQADDAERARVNVTRTLRLAIEKVEAVAPAAAAHLRASVRTGRVCRYDPGLDGPTWLV